MICYDGRAKFVTFFHRRIFDIFRRIRNAEYRFRRLQIVPVIDRKEYYDFDTNLTVQECLNFLDEEEFEVIVEIFLNGKTLRETSENCNGTSSTICRVRDRALSKMRQKCGV